MRKALALLVAGLAFFVAASIARADDALYSRLATDKFDAIEAAVTALATSGDPNAAAVVDALADGRLSYDPASKAVFYAKDGATIAAATGQPVAAPPSGLKKVKLNNRVRRAVEAAQGVLTLMSPDP